MIKCLLVNCQVRLKVTMISRMVRISHVYVYYTVYMH